MYLNNYNNMKSNLKSKHEKERSIDQLFPAYNQKSQALAPIRQNKGVRKVNSIQQVNPHLGDIHLNSQTSNQKILRL